jgi:hypothetical protein
VLVEKRRRAREVVEKGRRVRKEVMVSAKESGRGVSSIQRANEQYN